MGGFRHIGISMQAIVCCVHWVLLVSTIYINRFPEIKIQQLSVTWCLEGETTCCAALAIITIVLGTRASF